MQIKKRYIFDLVLIVSLLAVCLFLFFFVYEPSEAGAVAVVYLENDLIGEYPLLVDGEFSLNGGSNILKIEAGRAYMLYADCPDGWCKGQGRVSLLGERITCLPNRIMVIIEGGKR